MKNQPVKKQLIKPMTLFIGSLIMLIVIITFLWLIGSPKHNEVFQYIKILGAFCASGISIAIPGMIEVKDSTGIRSLASSAPKITASGAIAVFVIVYLYTP